MKPSLLILTLPFLFFGAHAQNSDTARIARIEPDSIALAPLIYLASDQLRGRHIGGVGISMAANYIVSQLRAAGARPVPRVQPVPGATAYFQVFTKTLSHMDFRKVGQDLKYNVPGFEPTKNFTLKNIVAYIPGTDPILRSQYIMLSAHYDHIGVADAPIQVDGKLDSIFNGARDNATGTAAVIAAAHYFGKYPPKRSVLLVLFTAEEEGELGSDYYTDYPLVPLEKTIFDLNVDNAGYNITNAICLFGLGLTSADSLIQRACLQYDLAVLPEPLGEDLFERSDNANLARVGVPAPCFSLGMKDWDKEIDRHYHQLSDEVDNMDLPYVVRFIRAYILSAKYIADDPRQPIWLSGDEFKKAWLKLYATPSHLDVSPQHATLPSPAHP